MIAHRSFIPLWISLALAAGAARAVTVEQIPSPRPAGWVVDLTGTLPASALADLNRLGDEVKAKTGAELAVVVVPTTDGADPHEFATRLFNTWGIGERGKDNGVLVFAALDDHAAEIVLGDGLDESAVRESEDIMQSEMVPRFREGNAAGALWSGARACAERIMGTAAAPQPPTVPQPPTAPAAPPQRFVYRPEPAAKSGFDARNLLLPGWLLGLAGLGIGLLLRKPRCPRCREKMARLDETADDAHLQASEQLEERIGSADHQVWVCPACGEKTKKRHVRFFSGYQDCPRCSVRALQSTTTTLETATYSSGGLVRIDEECVSCSYRNSFTRSTPRLESPSSGSSSFHGSGSSSGSSGFGGGQSSGGGSSGRW